MTTTAITIHLDELPPEMLGIFNLSAKTLGCSLDDAVKAFLTSEAVKYAQIEWASSEMEGPPRATLN